MKVSFAFVLCVVTVHAYFPLPKQILEGYAAECLIKQNLEPDFFKSGRKIFELTLEQRNCYMACMEKKKGLMNEDGSYNIDFALRHIIDPYEQEKKKALFAIIYEKCKAEVGNDVCRLVACIHLRPQGAR